MSIEYHQNGIKPEYDPVTHRLADNWDPDLDYGNEYVKVYFRIDTDGFECPNGFFTTTEAREEWQAEISKLISSFGILEDCGYAVEHSEKKQAYLHAHPNDISGVILKNDVKKIAEAIDSMETSSIRWVELYETVYVISDEEYAKYLGTKRNEIRYKLFDYAHTKRTTKYYLLFDVTRRIANEVKIKRLGLPDGDHGWGGQTVDYVVSVAKEMVEEGYLMFVEMNGGEYIRSLNKTEFNKSKLKPLEMEVA